MERLKFKTLSFPAMGFTRVLAALGIMLTLAACGSNGGSGGTAYVGLNGCTNCGALTTPVTLMTYNAQSAMGDVSLDGMTLYGNQASITNYAGSSPVYWYNGPIATQGTLTVRAPQRDQMGACYLAPGSYPVQTYSVGTMTSGAATFSQLTIPAIRATNADVELRIDIENQGQGFIASSGRLYARVTIVRVGSVACTNFYGTFN